MTKENTENYISSVSRNRYKCGNHEKTLIWAADIESTTTVKLSTTGGHVWDASYRLFDFLNYFFEDEDFTNKKVNILELGAGCGWLGLNLAKNLRNVSQVCLTEQVNGGAMEHLVLNCETAYERYSHMRDSVHVCGCDWTHYADDASPVLKNPVVESTSDENSQLEFCEWKGEMLSKDSKWDFVIGADLVYNDIGVHLLPCVIRSHLREGSKMVYAHTRGRFEHYDIDFFENLTAQGLRFREMREPGVPSPPPSPPPLTEVWRDMRIAIYEIQIIS